KLTVSITSVLTVSEVGDRINKDSLGSPFHSREDVLLKGFPSKVLIEVNHCHLVFNDFPCTVVCFVVKFLFRIVEDSTHDFTRKKFIRFNIAFLRFCHEDFDVMLFDEVSSESINDLTLTHL